MELSELKRDLPSIEGGRWVDRSEVQGLKGIRVKVRGHSSRAVRELFAKKEREAPESSRVGTRLTKEAQEQITREVIAEVALIDIEGLTIGGNPVTVDQLRPLLTDPAYDPLCDLISAASFRVDSTREADLERIKGNS